jgi:hypothetical protein
LPQVLRSFLHRVRTFRRRYQAAELVLAVWLLLFLLSSWLVSLVMLFMARSTALLTKSILVIAMALCLSGCAGRTGLTFRSGETQIVSSSLGRFGERLAGVEGLLDPPALVGLLIHSEVLSSYPPGELLGAPLQCFKTTTRISDVVRALEVREGWVYDPASLTFYVARATHSVDSPDAFGRVHSDDPANLARRPMLSLSFRFQDRTGGILGTAGNGVHASASLAGDGRVIELSVVDGVQTAWSKDETRTYYDGVIDPAAVAANNSGPRQVDTTLKTMTAGVQVSVLAARLPGDGFRMDGTFIVSSFSSATGLGQTAFTVPLQIDGPRHQWIMIYANTGHDEAATLAANPFLGSANFGSDEVYVLVRAD